MRTYEVGGRLGISMKPKSISDWYRILRVHYRPQQGFSRIRFALWLHAGVLKAVGTDIYESAMK